MNTANHLDVLHIKNFISLEQQTTLFNLIKENAFAITAQKGQNTNNMPRLIKWYGEKSYGYSSIFHNADPMPHYLETYLIKINALLTEKNISSVMNSVLINYYRDGNDKINFHSDDLSQIGEEPVIVSLSLGETRNFIFKNKLTKERINFLLSPGDLFIMKGKTQDFWQHGILPEPHKGERINCTFRNTIYEPVRV